MNRFSFVNSPLGQVERFIIHKENEAELEILSGSGLGLNAWRIKTPNEKKELLAGYLSEEEFFRTQNDTSAGVRLSPWPGRTNNAVWTWNGKTYTLDSNVSWAKHALHGLIHQKKWTFISFSSSETCGVARFAIDYTGYHTGFPFPFRAEVQIVFYGDSFEIKSSTINTGNAQMPYAEGFHPYFSLGEKIDNLFLTLPESEKVLVDSFDIPTGERLPETHFESRQKIGNAFINDCFALKNPENNAEIILENETEKLIVSQKTTPSGYLYFQIYTPPTRESVAIEPMTAEPDVLNHHRDLKVLNPGERLDFCWSAKYQRVK